MESTIPQHGRTILGDSFNEDETELKFLRSKPTCFIVIGKPGSGKTTLARKLAQIWRCELVHSTDIIQTEMEIGTEVGKKIQEVLLQGNMLSTDFVLHLLREKIRSPEVQHHGYVLDDLPILDEDNMTIKDQIEMIKGWKLAPDFIINIRIPDRDINERRVGLRADPITGDLHPREQWDLSKVLTPPKPMAEGEEEGEIEDEEEERMEDSELEIVPEFFELDAETIGRLVVPPESLPRFVTEMTENFKDLALKLLEEYLADHDQQYLIELDGNNAPRMLFQQLMNKLNTYVLRQAAVPIRLQNPDEEELPDEIETEELLRTLAAYQMPAPRYRWRRSKWKRICPVALKEGKILQGKPDLAVSFLDKMYVMSSPEAMTKFLKNPRPFLLPPFPKPPCKIAILGHPVSGKTSLSKSLAESYDATVLDVDELMKQKFLDARKDLVENARQAALESAINLVQNKLEQEAAERADARKREEQERQTALAEKKAEEEEEGEQKEGDEDQEEKEEDGEPPSGGDLITTDESMEETTTSDAREASPVPTITEDHPEVQKIISEAVTKAENEEIKLPADIYIAVLKDAIDKMIADRLEKDPNAARDGGWILDNFPVTKEQWGAMTEASVLPDEVICLMDKSANNDILKKRYYELNKETVTEKFRDRLIREKKKLLEEEEEIHLQREAMEEEIKDEKKEEEEVEESKEEGGTEEGDEKTTTESVDETIKTESSIRGKLLQEIDDLQTNYLGVPSHDSPEFRDFYEQIQDFEKEWASLQNSIGGVAASKPLVVNVLEKTVVEIANEARERIESPFGYKAWEFSGMDIDEEEEDNNADAEGEEEGEEDEEALRHKRKHFGYSKHYDPVSIKNDFVLWPGNPDIAAKYREKVYYFKSSDNRSKFVEKPDEYLPKDRPLTPPPPRILILGAQGSGKTTHGRWLAKKLGIFHISFRERLQEIILPKTGRKLGPEHEDEHLLKKEFLVSVEEAVKKATEENEQEEPPAEEEEEEKFELDDEQEAIRANIVDDEPLPPEILEKIVPPWWREEPFKSTGFILEGFPRTAEECQFLVQTGLFPDAAMLLMVEDVDVLQRLLPGRMDKWTKKRNHKNDKKNAIRDKKAEIRNKKIDTRRKELMKEREEAKAARLAEKAEAEGEEEEEEEEEEEPEEEDDIEELLAAEFEEEDEGEEEEEEQEEDASDRMKTEFGEKFDDDVTKLQAVQEQLEESMIPRIEIQSSRKPPIVRFLINQKIKYLVHNRSSMFEKVYPVSQELATKMLVSGYKHPSSFGRWDPVKLKECNDVIQPVQTPTNPLFPVIYHHHIYFLSDLDSRNKFMGDPTRYILHQPPAKPVVPIRMAILGAPKSGKTTLAQRYVNRFGVMRVSAGEALRQVIARQPNAALSIHIKNHLNQGSVVPDELTAEAVSTILLDTTCTTRGYVLDGYPNTIQQVELLSKRGIVPVRILELKIRGEEVIKRAAHDKMSMERIFPLHDSEEIFAVKLASFEEHIGAVRKFYETKHQNWFEIDGSLSKWKLWNVAIEDSKKSIRQIQEYLDRVARGEASRLNDLCISPAELQVRLGSYGEYCPVSLNKYGELVDCSVTSSLEFAAEFRARYYKMSTQENLEEFLAHPENYVPPLAQRKLPDPEMLPKRRTRDEVKAMFPKQIELKGYCPVSYADGKLRYEALVEGDQDLVVEYKDCLFVMETEEKLQKFMRLPEKYCDLKLPNKLPPKRQPMSITSLPMLGYLEQGSATSIIKALTAVGCFKPKFPFMSVERSCLLYVAYHLKAFNPRNSPYVRKKYKKKLENFEDSCQLIVYLGSNMTRRYRDPSERPIDFDHKMGRFLSLDGRPPMEGWAK